jgi:hypothetical protein
MKKKSKWDFWEHVLRGEPEDCWNWTGHKTTQGYGRITADGKNWWVHRLAYESKYGPPPEWSPKAEIQHLCSNPSCCNPEHLVLGDRAENMRMAGVIGNLSRKGSCNGNSKLSEEAVRNIRITGETAKELAEKYNVDESHIRRIKRQIQWRA